MLGGIDSSLGDSRSVPEGLCGQLGWTKLCPVSEVAVFKETFTRDGRLK